MAWLKRNIRPVMVLGLATAVCFGICWAVAEVSAVPTGSWGISFQTEGQPPVGNTSQTVLAQYDAAYVGNTKEQVLYLTFDAGYENGYTAQILDVL